MDFPEDCVQAIISPSEWWVQNTEKKLCRGALIWAFVPYFDQIPYKFEPIGRKDPQLHNEAKVKVSPLKVGEPLEYIQELPVAAMTLNKSEVWSAFRSKVRPCVILKEASKEVERSLIQGKPKHLTASTILCAPYYGADEDGRAGYNEQFKERIRHCEYPQFLWDMLPVNGAKESILRLDHLQPIGSHYNSYKVTSYKLSDDALMILDEIINLIIWGGLPPESFISQYRQEIEQNFKNS